MKQLIQSFKTGELGLFDVPAPICDKNGTLVKTNVSLVSAGTEKMLVDFAKKSMLAKAKDRPDLVKQVLDKMKKEGVKNTLEKVFTKLDTPIPLGYSLAGEVVQVGENLSGLNVGDRVACGGAGYANHAEINYVPKNLMVKIPDKVDDIDASFVTVGAIALQGIRQTAPLIGEKVAVVGLGLIGQLTVQLLKANGCKVIGSDIDQDKLNLAKKIGGEKWANELVTSINNAASAAVPGAADVFSGVIKNMSDADVKKVLEGGKDSFTKFLQQNSSQKLQAVFKPIITKMMSDNTFATAYNGLNSFVAGSALAKSDAAKQLKGIATSMGAGEYIPQEDEDLNDYITRKTLDGLFNVMSEKESSLRGGAVEQGTKILQGIFK